MKRVLYQKKEGRRYSIPISSLQDCMVREWLAELGRTVMEQQVQSPQDKAANLCRVVTELSRDGIKPGEYCRVS